MKILYCIAGTCHSGGMERVLTNKANYLVRHGYEVVVVTTDQQGLPPFFPLDKRIRCIDLHVNIALYVADLEVFAYGIELHFLVFAISAVAPEDAIATGISDAVLFVPNREAATNLGVLLVVAREEYKTF